MNEQLTLKATTELRKRLDQLSALRNDRVRRSQQLAREFSQVNHYLEISDGVTDALTTLNEQLFAKLLATVQEKMTVALQEILEQPVVLRADSTPKRNSANVEFYIEKDGHKEDILKGQGGSVANILSVGLRMFALMTLDEEQHRRFLVLDEQDCWLRPDLVPRLVKIVQEAGEALGFQVLMISHHDSDHFEKYADRIYRLGLNSTGAIEVEQLVTQAARPDRADEDD